MVNNLKLTLFNVHNYTTETCIVATYVVMMLMFLVYVSVLYFVTDKWWNKVLKKIMDRWRAVFLWFLHTSN